MDYYQTLGVAKTATDDEIKKAFRKLAMKHHPDRGGDEAQFKQIQEAYATLGDSEKRKQYDNPSPFGNSSSGFHQYGGFPPGFEDLFRSGQFGDLFGFRQQQRPMKNRDISLETEITLEDAFSGKTLTASIQLPSGREQMLEIKVPPGIHSGQRLRLAGMGDDSNAQVQRGDIYINIHIARHRDFERNGDDLLKEIEVSVWDAILGKEMMIRTLDNRQLNVTIPPGTQPDSVLRLAGYGMPNVNDNRFKGNILLGIKVSIPRDLTDEQKNLVKQLSA